MTTEEIARFESAGYAGQAVELRRIDDLAKCGGRVVPAVDVYRDPLLRQVRARPSPS
jgi:predicted HD phosphohydrolase